MEIKILLMSVAPIAFFILLWIISESFMLALFGGLVLALFFSLVDGVGELIGNRVLAFILICLGLS